MPMCAVCICESCNLWQLAWRTAEGRNDKFPAALQCRLQLKANISLSEITSSSSSSTSSFSSFFSILFNSLYDLPRRQNLLGRCSQTYAAFDHSRRVSAVEAAGDLKTTSLELLGARDCLTQSATQAWSYGSQLCNVKALIAGLLRPYLSCQAGGPWPCWDAGAVSSAAEGTPGALDAAAFCIGAGEDCMALPHRRCIVGVAQPAAALRTRSPEIRSMQTCPASSKSPSILLAPCTCMP